MLLDVEGDGPLVVVDPGDLTIEIDALGKFAGDMERGIGALLFTEEPGDHPARLRWPNAIVITPVSSASAPLLPPPVSGWETASLSPNRIGVYHKKARILLCGGLLSAGYIPLLDGGADSYLQALETIETFDTRLELPQRGSPAQGKREIRSRIAADREYTQNLVRHVLTSLAARLPLDRVLSVARDVYEDYPFVEDHLRNIEFAWQEFTGSR